jgi:hypothetical protein
VCNDSFPRRKQVAWRARRFRSQTGIVWSNSEASVWDQAHGNRDPATIAAHARAELRPGPLLAAAIPGRRRRVSRGSRADPAWR